MNSGNLAAPSVPPAGSNSKPDNNGQAPDDVYNWSSLMRDNEKVNSSPKVSPVSKKKTPSAPQSATTSPSKQPNSLANPLSLASGNNNNNTLKTASPNLSSSTSPSQASPSSSTKSTSNSSSSSRTTTSTSSASSSSSSTSSSSSVTTTSTSTSSTTTTSTSSASTATASSSASPALLSPTASQLNKVPNNLGTKPLLESPLASKSNTTTPAISSSDTPGPSATKVTDKQKPSSPSTQKLEPKPKRIRKSRATSAKAKDAETKPEPTGEKTATEAPKAAPVGPAKRKSRSASNKSTTNTEAAPASVPTTPVKPVKRSRKKKSDVDASPTKVATTKASAGEVGANHLGTTSMAGDGHLANLNSMPPSSSAPYGTGPLMINTPQPVVNNRLPQGISLLEGSHDLGNRYFSPMISPYTNFDSLNPAPSLSRSSLSRLFTSSLTNEPSTTTSPDDPTKAFEELREASWSHLHKCVLDQVQPFDLPSLIGTLYTLRQENEKLVNKIRGLQIKREQLTAMSARLDLPGPLLTQHLNNTSPGFSAVVANLTNSPKSLPNQSPGTAVNKQPLLAPAVGPFSHGVQQPPPGTMGHPAYLDSRSSPLTLGQPHSGTAVSVVKSSQMSTPSPPIGSLMAHGTGNRTSLITVNTPYSMPSQAYQTLNTMGSIPTPNPQNSTYNPRQ